MLFFEMQEMNQMKSNLCSSSWNMAGSILRYATKSPHDSLSSSAMRFSESPNSSLLEIHGLIQYCLCLPLQSQFCCIIIFFFLQHDFQHLELSW